MNIATALGQVPSWAAEFRLILTTGKLCTLAVKPKNWAQAERLVAARFGGEVSEDPYSHWDVKLPGGFTGDGVLVDVKYGDFWSYSAEEVDECKFFVLVSDRLDKKISLIDLRTLTKKAEFKSANSARLRMGGLFETQGSIADKIRARMEAAR